MPSRSLSSAQVILLILNRDFFRTLKASEFQNNLITKTPFENPEVV